MREGARRATTGRVSTTPDAIAGATAASQAARDWEAVRADAAIQFAPVPPPAPEKPPEWLKDLGEWLANLFEPLGRMLGFAGKPVLYGLAGLGVLLALWLLWQVGRRWAGWRPALRAEAEPEWTPAREAAMALLEDADRLAAEGRFAEATHLLLQRSVGQIAEARPEWLIPASTAREIAALPQLPEAARQAFGTIAGRVERGLFALRALDAGDWHEARAAYAAFALADLGRAPA